ncbi:FmdB family zinc ribbon protein [Caballeronia sordidicola]|uniref:FmdB family zinc ribbon protein n=1 Tax=Caballeronia sordidicola TaxID=196367 RepID=UPI000B777F9E|nr:FmdB family zinc ribbon protein [Caballeronia sordidicola]
MPVYDYECTECGTFEVVRRISERDDDATCLRCGMSAGRVVTGAPSLSINSISAKGELPGSYGMRHRGSCGCC